MTQISLREQKKAAEDGSFYKRKSATFYKFQIVQTDLLEIPFNTKPINTLYVQTAPSKNSIVICFTILIENLFHLHSNMDENDIQSLFCCIFA
jgi:hypothetical protein